MTATDATGKHLPASLELRAAGSGQELLIHVDAAGARGQITIDPFVQETTLTAYVGIGNSAVAIDGNTVVVGFGASNLAYVYTEPASGWASSLYTYPTAKLTASDGASGDSFGASVSISGNTVVVGAPDKSINGNEAQGAAYVFMEPASGWADMTQTAELTASNGKTSDHLGTSVSVSGNTVVAGCAGRHRCCLQRDQRGLRVHRTWLGLGGHARERGTDR